LTAKDAPFFCHNSAQNCDTSRAFFDASRALLAAFGAACLLFRIGGIKELSTFAATSHFDASRAKRNCARYLRFEPLPLPLLWSVMPFGALAKKSAPASASAL